MHTELRNVETMDDGRVLKLTWEDGLAARFHVLWLRDNAQDETTRSPVNGQKLITLQAIPAGVKACAADVRAGQLEVSFGPGGPQAAFSSAWLREHIYDRPQALAPVRPPAHAELWRAEIDVEHLTESFGALMEDDEALCRWLGHIRRFGFAKASAGPAKSGALLALVERFGFVRETNYGRWFEVRTEVSPTNLAFTGLGLQAHTDNPYRDPVPTLQLLYCLENSAEGGENQVVDGFAAACRLAEEMPAEARLLAEYEAAYEYRGADDVHLKARRPMIELMPGGELKAVRFNNRSIAANTSVPFEHMPAYYAAYRRLGEIVDDPAMMARFKLAPGEAFLVDNTRVLHGRSGYSATGGSRWLQGCYADMDGLLSTLSVIESRTR